MPPRTESSGLAKARKLVQKIAKDHGFLGEDVLGQMLPEIRRQVEEAMLKKDVLIGSSTLTLAKNLYNSSARFVFELLQNADDNSYTKARASSQSPYVSFHVYKKRIVVECNEDGFTRENLVAICSIGKSSKSGAQGYTGEKGIGFKSVFMVAWKVLIQSGDFSFYFQHKKGDSGMGMISPIWEDGSDNITDPLTRITLFLHDSLSDDTTETMLQQFNEIDAIMLLFLRNLKRIDVRMYDSNDRETQFTTYSISRQADNRVELNTERVKKGKTKIYSNNYISISHIAKDLPKSENREYSDEEIAQRAFAKAEVILAFPLNDDGTPIIKAQQIFAFLPIKTEGFSFLIQADFVTEANRQDIVTNSARNKCLLDHIAEAFVEAVSQCSTHANFRYQWMRFLPQEGEYPWGGYWRSLLDKIKLKLKFETVLWTRSHTVSRPIYAMRRLKSGMLDKLGDPLFPDSEAEQYLATEYARSDLDKLKQYGLGSMTTKEFLGKVRLDLDSDCSRIKSPDTAEAWHSRLAKFLISIFTGYSDTIEELALIPLIGGKWTSARKHSVYYPHVNGCQIPTDLGLRLVEPQAEDNDQRKSLFDRLDVKTYSSARIRTLIFNRYDSVKVTVKDVATSRDHLLFLYLTAQCNEEDDELEKYRVVHLLDQKCRYKKPHSDHIYFRNENPYGAHELFRASKTEFHLKAPGLDVAFIHDDYMKDPPKQPKNEDRTWDTWLEEMVNIRRLIPFCEENGDTTNLGKECLYVAKYRPEMFLGFLVQNWERDGERVKKSLRLAKDMLQLQILCENGRMHPLGETYFPAAEHDYARRFLEDDEFFPWIRIEESFNNDAKMSDLQNLAKELGFGHPKSELEFCLTVLRFIYLSNKEAKDLKRTSRVLDLYKRISTRYSESVAQKISREHIQEAFKLPLIYVPGYGSEDACWAEPACCLWEAPAYMTSFHPLKLRYKDIKDSSYFKTLFHKILKIRDLTVEDLTMELFNLREDWCTDFDRISSIYKELEMMIPKLNSSQTKAVCESFQQDSLIFVPADWKGDTRWLSTSQCLWSTATKINGKATLNDQYESFFDFFVKFLGVNTLTLEMVIDKLKEQGKVKTPVKEIKDTMWVINDFLQNEKEYPNADRILDGNLFPIRYPDGTIRLCSSDTDFAIADREHLLDLYSGKCKILDFEVNETIRLRPFLQWAGLEKRCLSLSTKEISALCGDAETRLDSIDRDLARKAYGLLRIAVHFGSPRVRAGESSFYAKLKKIEVRETDGISSELHLIQDGKVIIVKLSTSELHLQDHEDGLRIYVPRDEEQQGLCFLDRIPKALLEWIMTEPSTGICEDFDDKAIDVMQKILQATTKQVSSILERAGIVSIKTPDDSIVNQTDAASHINTQSVEDDVTSNHSKSDSDWERNTLVQDPQSTVEQEDLSEGSNVVDITYTSAGAAHRSSAVTNPIYVTTSRREARGPRMSLTPETSQPDEDMDLEYLNILRSIVNHARRTVFPSRGTFDMGALTRSLETFMPEPYSDYFGLRSSERIERDKKIGAAGELFMFEVLSRLNPTLPNFSRNNWQSTIRQYVTIHEDYADLTPWSGRETADITYNDSEGVLTNFLVDKGYLDTTRWSGIRPRYLLEVKSTTGPCETSFYMIKYQYERMQRNSNGPAGFEQTDYIYVILRVFNVGKDSVDMRVYVDPEVMRESNELRFTAETWSIIPSSTRS